MRRRLIVGDMRVQEVRSGSGRVSWTIVWPEGNVYKEADRYLRRFESEPGTQRTYAYLLVDHLRWLEREALTFNSVVLRDLVRYMGLVGAEVPMPLGEPWRTDKKPYGKDALSALASVLKSFYLELASTGIGVELGRQLDVVRLPSKADRDRSLLGHVKSSMPANPLTPRRGRRRHPRMLPEGARPLLLEAVNTAQDQMVVTWLLDGGLRVGELCGLHLVDLHLREHAACGQAKLAHAHVCHREGNLNGARAKSKHPWEVSGGVVTGGLVKRVSPAMIHTYFEYMTNEYPRAGAEHGMLLVQLAGPDAGQPLTTSAVAAMFGRAARRTGLGHLTPHQCRHNWTTAVLDAAGGNLVIARDAGGWASTAVVDEVYGHVDLHDPDFEAALRMVWGELW